MCYLLQNPVNLLFPLQIKWSIFSQWWISEWDHITCSQVAGANQLHISSPVPLLLWFAFLWTARRGCTETREGEAECTVSTHRKHKPCTAVAPLCLSSWRRSLCLALELSMGTVLFPRSGVKPPHVIIQFSYSGAITATKYAAVLSFPVSPSVFTVHSVTTELELPLVKNQ